MAEQILALAIYKNIWPQYYGKVTSGESIELFPTNVAKNKKLAEVLVDSRYQFLTYENLCYLGYSRDKLIYNITNYIKGGKVYRNQIEVISSFPVMKCMLRQLMSLWIWKYPKMKLTVTLRKFQDCWQRLYDIM